MANIQNSIRIRQLRVKLFLPGRLLNINLKPNNLSRFLLASYRR